MELYKEIVLSLLGILVIFGLGYWRGRRRRQALAENEGEGAVRRWLTKGLAPTQFHLMNNVTLPFEGITAHIDHILLGPTGIFVIETKHYTGGPLLVPPAPHAEWRQQWGRSSYHRDNALSQNARHVRAVRTRLDFVPPQHMHSLVVFTGTAQLPPGHPANVLHLPALMGHIRSYTHTVLTTQDLHLCLGRLEWTRRRISRQTDVAHVQNLNRRFGTRLLLDFRVVDLPRSSNRIVVTLPSFMPLFFKGLFKAITLPGQRWSLRPWNPIRAI